MWAAALSVGCSFKPAANGVEGGLVAIADPLDRPVVQRTLEASFGRVIYTPQPEPLFNIVWHDAGQLGELTRNPLILITAAIGSDNPTAGFVRKMLTPEVEAGVQDGRYEVFKINDPWARGQLLIVLVGRSQRELGNRCVALSDSLLKWAVDFERDRLTRSQFARGERKDLSGEIADRFGFRVRIQHDYFLAEENDSLKFIRLLRRYPERWLTVFWGDIVDSSQFTPDFIYKRRKAAGTAFADPLIHYDDRWGWEWSDLSGRPAVLVRGLWATAGPLGGGPFFSYGVYYPDQKRYYIIDGACFAPGEAKMPFLWQLDVIACTFSLNGVKSE